MKVHLFEGILQVPYKVSKQLRDIAEEAYSAVVSGETKNLRRIKRDLVLDFSGTRFNFLNKFAQEYPLKVRIRQTKNSDAYYLDKEDHGLIVLNIPGDKESFENLYKVDIDHELVHYIQVLIQRAKGLKHVGGLGKRKIQTKGYDPEGYKGKGGLRRRKHALREVEYQAIANTLLQTVAMFKYKNPEMSSEQIMKLTMDVSDELQLLRDKDPKKFRNMVKGLYIILNSPDFDNLTRSFVDYKDFIKKNRVHLIKKLLEK